MPTPGHDLKTSPSPGVCRYFNLLPRYAAFIQIRSYIHKSSVTSCFDTDQPAILQVKPENGESPWTSWYSLIPRGVLKELVSGWSR